MTGAGFEGRFLPEPAEVPAARAALRHWLKNNGPVAQDRSEDILIVTTELVTNGVYHDGGDLITVRVGRDHDDIAIEVITVAHAPGRHPTYRDFTDPLETGLGLRIVRAMSQKFAVVMHGDQRVTSCHIALG